jgi:4'-phosphopantetheinyl transferase
MTVSDANGMTLGVARGTRTGRPLLRALVAELVAQLAGVASDHIDPATVRIEARCPDCGGAHGRPVVMAPEAARRIHVSLSHVGDIVVGVASVDRTIGVDAEPTGALADPERAHRIRELIGLDVDPGADVDALLRWTAVEAVLKADGRGLRVDPRTVVLEPAPLEPADGAWHAAVPGDPRRYTVTEVPVEGLRVSVARER